MNINKFTMQIFSSQINISPIDNTDKVECKGLLI